MKTEVDVQNKNQTQEGIGFALIAYGSWGVLPVYWKLLRGVHYAEILSHRIIWSAFFLILFLVYKEGRQFKRTFLDGVKHWRHLFLSASFITVNWFVYVYAVNSNRVLEASLGYFIAPLVNILLGTFVLKEKLSGIQKLSVGLAAIGVLRLSLQIGRVPVLALLLAMTFGMYGLIRKRIPLNPLVASALESTIQILPAFFIFLLSRSGIIVIGAELRPLTQTVYLILSGVVTALPLLWFANAAKRLPLSSLGFFQYLSPSLQLVLAVFLYSEPFSPAQAESFFFIWGALGLYCSYLWRHRRLAK